MPYYIEACLLRSPYFVTFAALKARTVKTVLAQSGRFSDPVTYIRFFVVGSNHKN